MDTTRLKEINDSITDKNLSIRRHNELLNASVNTSNTILSVTESLVKYLNGHISKVELTNQLSSIRTPDVFKVVEAVNSLHDTLKTHKDTDLSEVTKVMQSILDEAKKIPKELPKETEQKFIDYTKQFESMAKAIKAVEKVVKEQKLIAEAPIVNLPETQVNVEAPDLKPLQASLKAVVTAVEGIVIPEYKTDNKALEELVKKSNKLLKELVEKPISRGGGGGGIVSYVNSAGLATPVTLTAGGKVPVEATLNVGDIEIGAVEIKDGTTDARAVVSSTDGILVNLGTNNDVTVSGVSTADNQTNGTQQTKIKETVPTDATKNNSSTALLYDGNGDLQYIDETIGTDVYRTTLTYTARVLVGISKAVKQ
jgi:hypothetical protein